MENGDDNRPGTGEGELGRRGFLGLLGMGGAMPVLLPAGSPAVAALAAPARHECGVFERMFGLKAVINAAGPVTALGGTRLSPEVTAAMAEASRGFVDLNQLYAEAGKRLARFTRTEDAMITSGAFAAMTLGAAACLAGTDPGRMAALPRADWPRREVLIQRLHSTAYEQAYRNAGMTIVHVESEAALRAAISERTAMIGGLVNTDKMADPGIIPLDRLVEIGKGAGVPVLFDASFSITHCSDPSRLWRYTQMGADLLALSGGKGLHGPQSTGILAGRADLIAAARTLASPNPGGLGRGMKVDKEEVVGLIVAIDQFLARDSAAIYRRDRARVETMKGHFRDIPGIRFGYEEAFFGPGLVLMWDEAAIPISYADFVKAMQRGDRPVAMLIASGPTAYFVNEVNGPALFAGYLNDGEEVVVAERARSILLAALDGHAADGRRLVDVRRSA